MEKLTIEAIELLKHLVGTPSFSKEEEKAADVIQQFLIGKEVSTLRKGNNIWAYNQFFDPSLPTILLNSHHDTVKPNKNWTESPFVPVLNKNKLTGLGTNDAGASVVSLLATFLRFYKEEKMSYNICVAITAEEEISGPNGIELILPELGDIDFAIVGEPTQMHLAVAERGLMVLDCVAKGRAGHAARDEGENAIYTAMDDINWFKTFQFPKVSEFLGPVKMTVTQINAGELHNVVPDTCKFIVDIRLNECYTHEEILSVIDEHVKSDATPRSMRLKPSSIPTDHPFVVKGKEIGRELYGSPTSSDMALMNFPSVKVGPGKSERSHTANEFILLEEIEEGIKIYSKLLSNVLFEE